MLLESSNSNFLYKKTRILRDAMTTLFRIDASLSVALSGIPSDCRHILSLLRKEAQDYRSNCNEPIPLGLLADKVSSYLHDLTLSSDTRPLAVTILLGARYTNSLPVCLPLSISLMPTTAMLLQQSTTCHLL